MATTSSVLEQLGKLIAEREAANPVAPTTTTTTRPTTRPTSTWTNRTWSASTSTSDVLRPVAKKPTTQAQTQAKAAPPKPKAPTTRPGTTTQRDNTTQRKMSSALRVGDDDEPGEYEVNGNDYSPYNPVIQATKLKPGDTLPAWIRFQMERKSNPPDAGFVARPNVPTYQQYEAGRAADQAAMQAQANDPGRTTSPFQAYRESQIAADKEAGTAQWWTTAGQALQTVFQQDDPVSAMQLPTGAYGGTGFTERIEKGSGVENPVLAVGQFFGPALTGIRDWLSIGAKGDMLSPYMTDEQATKALTPQTAAKSEGQTGNLPARIDEYATPLEMKPTTDYGDLSPSAVVGRVVEPYQYYDFAKLNASIAATNDPELKKWRQLATMRGFQGAPNALEDDLNIQYKYNIGKVKADADAIMQTEYVPLKQLAAQARAMNDYDTARTYEEQAAAAQQKASALYQNYNQWSSTPYHEIIDANEDWVLLMAQGIGLDPLNLVDAPLGALVGATGTWLKSLRPARKLAQAADLTKAVAQGVKMMDEMAPKGADEAASVVGRDLNWWQRMTQLTPESAAAEDAGNILQGLFYILKDIDNVADLDKVLTALVRNPETFVRRMPDGSFVQEGVTGLTSQALQSNGGRLVVSPKILLSPEMADNYKLMPRIVDEVLKSDVVQKSADGALDKFALFNELDKAAYHATRWNRGLQAIDDLPEGTAKYVVGKFTPTDALTPGMAVRTADDVAAVVQSVDPQTGAATLARLDSGEVTQAASNTVRRLDIAEGNQARRIVAGDVVRTADGAYHVVTDVKFYDQGSKVITVGAGDNARRFLDKDVTVLKPAKQVGERATIDFLDANGAVIGHSAQMSPQEARIYKKQLDRALKAGGSNPVTRFLNASLDVERSFLSDMYLNLRPGHWIRNAMSATAALMSDGIYSLEKTDDVLSMLMSKGVMSPRILEAATGITPGKIPHAYENLGGIGRRVAKASKAANQVWTGRLEMLGTIPFGEQAFYIKGFGKAFERSFREVWQDTAARTIAEWANQVGLDPRLTRDLINVAVEAGIRGGSNDVRRALTEVIMGRVQPFILRNLGVKDEVLSLQGEKQLAGIINEWLTSSPTPDPNDKNLRFAIDNLFAAEQGRYAALLRNAPPQRGNYIWTAQELKNDTSKMLDDYVSIATEAGIDRQVADQQAQAIVIPAIQAERQAWGEFYERLAGVEESAAMNVAFDLYARIDAIKQAARAQVDALMKPVRAAATPEERDLAWQMKFAATNELYTRMAKDIQGVFDDAVMDVRKIEVGENVERKFDWSKVIDKYTSYDEQKVLEERAIELGSSTDTAPETWETVIAAQRAYVDQSFYEVYEAFRRFPSMETFDMLRSTQQQIDELGAKAAAYLAPIREKALAKNKTKTWEAYFRVRNALWRQTADEQVIYNRAATQAIVANGLSIEGSYDLRWRTTNIFDGDYTAAGEPAEYVLVGLSEDGLMTAYRTDTGETMQFALPGHKRALPMVPDNVREIVRNRLTLAASVRQRAPIDLSDANWTDTTGRTWQIVGYNPDRQIFRAVDAQGNSKLFAAEPGGLGLPEVPANVYASWQKLIGEDFDARIAAEAETLRAQAKAQNAPRQATAGAQQAPEAPQVQTPQSAPAAAPSPSTQPSVQGESLLSKAAFKGQTDETPLMFYYNPDAPRFWRDANGKWGYVSPQKAGEQGLIKLYGTAEEAAAATGTNAAVRPVYVVSKNPQQLLAVDDPQARFRITASLAELGENDAIYASKQNDVLIRSADQMRFADSDMRPAFTPEQAAARGLPAEGAPKRPSGLRGIVYDIKNAFGVSDVEARTTASLINARAQRWAQQTGRPASEWFTTHIADIVKGGTFDPNNPNILFQHDPYAAELTRMERMKDRKRLWFGPKTYQEWNGKEWVITHSGKEVARDTSWQQAVTDAHRVVAATGEDPLFKPDYVIRLWQTDENALAKGSAEFLDDGRAIIRAFQSADVSTAVHEVGHIFRRDLAELAADNAEVAADMRTLEKWAGVTDGAWTVEAEEKFARGFEQYLANGKAPTKGLQGIFERFKTWLANIYASIKQLTGEELPQDVRVVYDRLFADVPIDAPVAQVDELIAPVDDAAAQVDEPLTMAQAPVDDSLTMPPAQAAPVPDVTGGFDDITDTMPPSELPMSERTRRAIHATGNKLYGKQWNDQRHSLVSEITGGRETSTARGTTLTENEAAQILSRLNAEAAARADLPPEGERIADIVADHKQTADDLQVIKQVAEEQGVDTAAIDEAIAEHSDSIIADVVKMEDEAAPPAQTLDDTAQAAPTPVTVTEYANGDTVLYNGQEVTVSGVSRSQATGRVKYDVVTADRQYIEDLTTDELQPVARQVEEAAAELNTPTIDGKPVVVWGKLKPRMFGDANVNRLSDMGDVWFNDTEIITSVDLSQKEANQVAKAVRGRTVQTDNGRYMVVRQAEQSEISYRSGLESTELANVERAQSIDNVPQYAPGDRVQYVGADETWTGVVKSGNDQRIYEVMPDGEDYTLAIEEESLNRVQPPYTEPVASTATLDTVAPTTKAPRIGGEVAAAPTTSAPAVAVDETALRAELAQLQEQRNAQYWAFTRQAKAKPVDAAITRRIGEIERQLGIAPDAPWKLTFERAQRNYNMNETAHRLQIEKALQRGDAVPPEVLDEYPDLAAKYAPQAAPTFTVSPDDVDYKRAYAAFAGSSFTPERGATRIQSDYVSHMTNLYQSLSNYAKTDADQETLLREIERYREGYLKRLYAWLDADARTVSSMITGSSNFPVARNAKRLETAQKRLNEFVEWQDKAQRAIFNELTGAGGIRSDSPTAIADLQKKLDAAERLQEMMKAANKVVKGKGTDDEKIAKMVDLGFTDAEAREALKPDFIGRFGFPDYKLQNNNAEIKRVRDRIAQLEKLSDVRGETAEWAFEGGRVVDNVEEGRVQVIFNERISKEQHEKMRSLGFVYSRRNEAYQRQRPNARYAVINATGIDIDNRPIVEQVAEQVDDFQPITGVSEALTREDDVAQAAPARWEPANLTQTTVEKYVAAGATPEQLQRLDAAISAGDTEAANVVRREVIGNLDAQTAEAIFIRGELDAATPRIPREELERVDLIRRWGDKWQYRTQPGGKWFYANSEEGAIETATETYRRTSPDDLLTPAERFDKAEAARFAEWDSRHGRNSLSELKAMMDRASGGTYNFREMTGTGDRRTAAAVNNQGLRDAGEFRLQMNIYLEERVKRALANGETVPDDVLAMYPDLQRAAQAATEPVAETVQAVAPTVETAAPQAATVADLPFADRTPHSSKMPWRMTKDEWDQERAALDTWTADVERRSKNEEALLPGEWSTLQQRLGEIGKDYQKAVIDGIQRGQIVPPNVLRQLEQTGLEHDYVSALYRSYQIPRNGKEALGKRIAQAEVELYGLEHEIRTSPHAGWRESKQRDVVVVQEKLDELNARTQMEHRQYSAPTDVLNDTARVGVNGMTTKQSTWVADQLKQAEKDLKAGKVASVTVNIPNDGQLISIEPKQAATQYQALTGKTLPGYDKVDMNTFSGSASIPEYAGVARTSGNRSYGQMIADYEELTPNQVITAPGQKVQPNADELNRAAKVTFTNKDIIKNQKGEELLGINEIDGAQWWTDGHAAFSSDVPKVFAGINPSQPDMAAIFPKKGTNTVRLMPVGETALGKTPTVVLMNDKGAAVTIQTKYYAEVMRIAEGMATGKGKATKIPEVIWTKPPGVHKPILASINGKRVALIMPIGDEARALTETAARYLSPVPEMVDFASTTPRFQAPAGAKPIDWRLMFGQRRLENVRKKAKELGDQMRATWGKPKDPEIGNVAVHQVSTLADAKQRVLDSLPNIATQPKGGINASAQRFLLNNIDKSLVNKFDDSVMVASEAARNAADGAMLNYQRRRGFDVALGKIYPYHYFWTRGTYTWAKRLARKPSLANLLYETQRAIDMTYQREGLPERLDGTLMVHRDDKGQLRLRNPIEYVMPSLIYGGGSFYNPEDGNNAYERAMLSLKRWTPGFFPHVDIMLSALFDAAYPLADGSRRTEQYMAARRYVPIMGIASDMTMASGNDPLSTIAGGDKWDQYRIRRTAAVMLEEGEFGQGFDAQQATRYANQISANLELGQERYTDIPEEWQERAEEVYKQAAARAGQERLYASAGSMFAGNSAYYYPDAEADLKQQQAAYSAAGFSEANPAGSSAQKKQVLEDNPNLPVWWTKNIEGDKTPAQSAKDAQMWQDLGAQVYAPREREIAVAIAQNIGDKEAQLEAIRAIDDKYDAAANAIFDEYDYQSSGDASTPTGADPYEAARASLENMLNYDAPYPVKPEKFESNAQKNAYYKEQNQWYADRVVAIENRIAQVFDMYRENPDNLVVKQLVGILEGMDVDALIREYATLKHATPDEAALLREDSIVKQQDREQRAAGMEAVGSILGEEWVNRYNNYLDLEDDDRKLARDQYPQISAINLIVNNFDKYQELVDIFGEEAFQAWANRPAKDDEEAWDTYYSEHRDAWLVSAWLNGRPRGETGEEATRVIDLDNPGGDAVAVDYYNFGKDYQTAIEKFGEDIWEIAANYSSKWSKKQKAQYFDKYPQLDKFYDWWYGLLDDDNQQSKYTGYRSSYRRSYYPRRSYYRRSYGGYSRGYSSGYGGYSSGGGYTPKVYPPDVYAREFDRNLQVNYPSYAWEPRTGWNRYWTEAGDTNNRRSVEYWRPRTNFANKSRW